MFDSLFTSYKIPLNWLNVSGKFTHKPKSEKEKKTFLPYYTRLLFTLLIFFSSGADASLQPPFAATSIPAIVANIEFASASSTLFLSIFTVPIVATLPHLRSHRYRDNITKNLHLMDPKYTGEMLKHLEKQDELLMDAYRSMSHELHKLQVEEEMLMRAFYDLMASQGLATKRQDGTSVLEDIEPPQSKSLVNVDSNKKH
uniref:Uncharacterized protein n=1 Tax=Lactuca sativa TaxID=4236 RepID=A0A9R1UM40_LACSA|nr:hypothetical protein LSAT_V11C800395810 [Lactuca sativa]